MPMHLLHAVRGPLALEVVPLHRTLKAAALRHARHINGLHAFHHLDRDLATHSQFACRPAQLANESLRLRSRLGRRLRPGIRKLLGALAVQIGNMTTFTATGQAARLIGKPKLNRVIAIVLLGPHLKHVTRARLNNGDGDAQPRLVINLRHPDLAAEYSLGHRNIPSGLVAPRDSETSLSHYPRCFQSIKPLRGWLFTLLKL